MNKPLVSICCITYNHEQFIAQALDGFIMQQTNFEFEIVISDDCSTDNTRAVIEKYKNKYPHKFKDISPKRNLGMAKNFLYTLSNCTGEFIALCEGDDYWTDSLKLQKQMDFLETHTDYTLCAHRCQEYHEHESQFKRMFDDIFIVSSPIEITIHNFLQPYILATHTIVFRNCIDLKQISYKGFKDIFLFALLLDKGKGICLPEFMGVYRIHEGGIWSTKELIQLYKANAETAYYLKKHFCSKYESITQFAWITISGYLEELYSQKQSIWLIIKISYRIIILFPEQITLWHKKQMCKRILRYCVRKK